MPEQFMSTTDMEGIVDSVKTVGIGSLRMTTQFSRWTLISYWWPNLPSTVLDLIRYISLFSMLHMIFKVARLSAL